MYTTSCLGIHESTLILQSALRAAFADLRRKPWLLSEFCFQQLQQDELLKTDYGVKEVEKIVQWFLTTDIKILERARLNKATFPCISIALLSSVESDNTLGDINYDPREKSDLFWPTVAGPIDALSYDPVTGYLTIPTQNAPIVDGMLVVTTSGHEYEISSMPDDNILAISTNLNDTFAGLLIKPTRPALVAALESVRMQDVYNIGCHVQGGPEYAEYLHSILRFALFMYRQSLLEKRGLEQTSIQCGAQGEVSTSALEGNNELVYSRDLQMTGYVRNTWPKNISPLNYKVEFKPYFVEASNNGDIAFTPDFENDDPWGTP